MSETPVMTPAELRGRQRKTRAVPEPELSGTAGASADEPGIIDEPEISEDAGNAVDAAVVDIPAPDTSDNSGRGNSRNTKKDDEPRSGPPRLDEWQHLFSNVILRGLTDFYIDHRFAEIDENLLSDRDIQRLKLSESERDRIAKPISELANKLKITRKHGRTVIAAAGTLDSAWAIGMWFSRVNRIAAKYDRRRPVRGHVVQAEQGDEDERTGPRAESNGHSVPARGYTIYQPGTG